MNSYLGQQALYRCLFAVDLVISTEPGQLGCGGNFEFRRLDFGVPLIGTSGLYRFWGGPVQVYELRLRLLGLGGWPSKFVLEHLPVLVHPDSFAAVVLVLARQARVAEGPGGLGQRLRPAPGRGSCQASALLLHSGKSKKNNLGALIIAQTILGVPYYTYSVNPILVIKCPAFAPPHPQSCDIHDRENERGRGPPDPHVRGCLWHALRCQLLSSPAAAAILAGCWDEPPPTSCRTLNPKPLTPLNPTGASLLLLLVGPLLWLALAARDLGKERDVLLRAMPLLLNIHAV